MKKQEKGITLIALIITIVVLLILAVVAINAIQDGGILEYANNSASTYNQAQVNEQTVLGGYVDWIEEQTCKHDYVNGECKNCGYSPCSEGHTYENGKCTKCGYTSCNGNHTYGTDGICSVCGVECKHDGATSFKKYTEWGHEIICSTCKATVKSEGHNYIQNGDTHTCNKCNQTGICEANFILGSYCVWCGGSCNHENLERTYVDEQYHSAYCRLCQEEIVETHGPWESMNGFHICSVCHVAEEGCTVPSKSWGPDPQAPEAHSYGGDCSLCGEYVYFDWCTADEYKNPDCTICNP